MSGAAASGEGPVWEVFVQEKAGDPHKHAGSVHAHDAEMALQHARDVYARRGQVASMWVVPHAAISASMPADNASFFDPADDKIYRLPAHYLSPASDRRR
ncbi:MAG: 1,2-phenylacetyl-CoA epoxidase subunit B [Planctomycetes bacterium]|nr:1,2-phenylacetyl-CoA epoxidase subunit B [Planctomycetota bacterium]